MKGEVDFPPYLKEFHSIALTGSTFLNVENNPETYISFGTSIDEEVTNIVGNNPLESMQAFNPDTVLTEMDTRLSTFTTTADAIDPEDDWEGFVDTVLSRVDELVSSDDDIEEEVETFEEVSRRNLAKAYSRFDAGMFDINAVVSSVFPAGRALIEAEYNHDVSRFRSERRGQRNRERAMLIMQSVDAMKSIYFQKLSMAINAFQLTTENARMEIGAKTDQSRIEASYRIDEAMWNLRALNQGAGVIATMSGIPTVQPPMTPLQVLAGGLTTTAGVAIPLASISPEAAVGLGIAGIALSFYGAVQQGGGR